MAALYERLMGVNTDGRPKIPVHQFMASVAEQQRGNQNPAGTRTTAAMVIAAFALDATEQVEAQDLIARFPTNINAEQVHNVLMMAERGVGPFTRDATGAQAVRTRFGVPTR
jgi:hypothetical protein